MWIATVLAIATAAFAAAWIPARRTAEVNVDELLDAGELDLVVAE
jgi:hypothetical protein